MPRKVCDKIGIKTEDEIFDFTEVVPILNVYFFANK